MRLRAASLLAIVALVAAGCASTNKGRTKRATGGASPATEASIAPEASAAAKASSAPGAATRTSKGKVSAPRTGGLPPGVTPKPIATGHGVKNNKVYIGFHVSKNLETGFTVIGASQSTQGSVNERPMVDALVKWLNSTGGITGREVVPVIIEYDALADGSWDQQAAKACNFFTQDNEVLAVVTSHVGGTDALQRCLSKAKIPVVQQNQWPYDSVHYREFAGYIYQPSRMIADRWAPVYIRGLKDAGYFEGATVGLLRFSGETFDRLTARYKDALDGVGVKIASEFTVTTPTGTSDFGAMNSQLQSAVLQFQSKNVTHVIFAEYGSIIPFFFTNVAESQGFRPRYGASSIDLPATMAGQNPEEQLKARGGAIAISWIPGQDVRRTEDPRDKTGGPWDACQKIMNDAGITPAHPLYAGYNCENVWFVRAVLDKASEVSSAGFKTGAELLGTSFQSPFGWPATRFGAGRSDGAVLVRTMVFKPTPCRCFQYVPGERTVP
jgi:hypothetical protein